MKRMDTTARVVKDNKLVKVWFDEAKVKEYAQRKRLPKNYMNEIARQIYYRCGYHITAAVLDLKAITGYTFDDLTEYYNHKLYPKLVPTSKIGAELDARKDLPWPC